MITLSISSLLPLTIFTLVYSIAHSSSLLSAVFRYIAKAPLRDGYKGGSSRAPIYEGSVNDDVPLLGASTYTKIDSDGADSSGMHAPINQRTFLKYFNIGHNLTELFHKSEQRSEYDVFCCCLTCCAISAVREHVPLVLLAHPTARQHLLP